MEKPVLTGDVIKRMIEEDMKIMAKAMREMLDNINNPPEPTKEEMIQYCEESGYFNVARYLRGIPEEEFGNSKFNKKA